MKRVGGVGSSGPLSLIKLIFHPSFCSTSSSSVVLVEAVSLSHCTFQFFGRGDEELGGK